MTTRSSDCRRTTAAPRATRRATSSSTAPGARRSRCTRFFAVFGSGTCWNHTLGPPQPGGSAKAFYVDKVGFNADHDHQVSDTLRFVQLTPPGSACSVVMGTGITDMPPGSQRGVQVVVEDVAAARQQLLDKGVEVSDVDVMPW